MGYGQKCRAPPVLIPDGREEQMFWGNPKPVSVCKCVPSKELCLFSVTTFSWQMPSLWTRPCYNILSFLSPCVPDAPHADSLSLQRRPAHALLLPDDVARVHCYCVFSEIPGVSVECGIGKAQKVGQDVWPLQKVSKGCLSRPFLCRVPGVE